MNGLDMSDSLLNEMVYKDRSGSLKLMNTLKIDLYFFSENMIVHYSLNIYYP